MLKNWQWRWKRTKLDTRLAMQDTSGRTIEVGDTVAYNKEGKVAKGRVVAIKTILKEWREGESDSVVLA